MIINAKNYIIKRTITDILSLSGVLSLKVATVHSLILEIKHLYAKNRIDHFLVSGWAYGVLPF